MTALGVAAQTDSTAALAIFLIAALVGVLMLAGALAEIVASAFARAILWGCERYEARRRRRQERS